MKRSIRLIISFSISFSIVSPTQAKESIHYQVSMPEPHSHYFEVAMTIKDVKNKYIDLKLPVWAPGSYLVRDFPKNIDRVKAKGMEGSELHIYKIDKNTWRVESNDADQVEVHYRVYAFEISVRSSYLDGEHGYINGTSVFVYVDGFKELPVTLDIIPLESWSKVSTALKKSGKRNEEFYHAANYDILVDSPIEIGNHKEIQFNAAGIPHTIAIFGDGNYDEEVLKKDFRRIAEKCVEIFGSNPNDHYLFILHNLDESGGALEHLNSTTIQKPWWIYGTESWYKSFLTTVAHEYIHVWLVKRLRPEVLGPFDYDKENYTTQLWVMEGFTSYLSQLILCQLGYIENYEFINYFADRISDMETSEGTRTQSVSEASFDAWIKAYQPHENSSNTTISYYVKGSVLANLIDLLIIYHSDAEQDLGDALEYLYENHYLKDGKGVTSDEIKEVFELFSKTDLNDFYRKYVHGTEEIDYDRFFELAGLKVEKKLQTDSNLKLGIRTSESEGKLIVKSVREGSSAWKYGVYANDEVIAVDGYRVSQRGIGTVLQNKKPNDVVEVLVARKGRIKSVNVTLQAEESYYYMISPDKDKTEKNERVLAKWLDD